MPARTLRITVSGTGFAGNYTAQVYGLIPHKNGVTLDMGGVTSGHLGNAKQFAERHGIRHAYESHAEMIEKVQPDIDNIASANHTHGPYAVEAAQAGVKVVVLEKPPVIWPGYGEGRTADAKTRKRESMDYLAGVLDKVRETGARLLYAEDFVYVNGVRGIVEVLREAMKSGKGKILYQRGVCAHQGSHAPAYDTPEKSGGGSLFNKACHPLGPFLFLKQVEGILRQGKPIRPVKVAAVAMQILKHQPKAAGRHFRVMQNVDDFAHATVVFEDHTVAEVLGYDLSIGGIRNELSVIADFGQYDVRINPNNENELFLPAAEPAGDILFREKLPTPLGTSFPRPDQFHSHGYVNEMEDAVDCALDPKRHPASGAMTAWDTMAVLMAGYESSEQGGAFVDITEYTLGRAFEPREMPDPDAIPRVFQRP